MEGFESRHLENAFTGGLNSAVKQERGVSRVWGKGLDGKLVGESVWAGEGQSGGVYLQLVLIMRLMWRSDLKHTLTLQAQVKAGYGFQEAPSLLLLYHSFPPWSTMRPRASFIERTLHKICSWKICGVMKLEGVSRCSTSAKYGSSAFVKLPVMCQYWISKIVSGKSWH